MGGKRKQYYNGSVYQIETRSTTKTGMSSAERWSIYSAFQRGHWYMCPNGHIYHVGECGTPQETSNCIECGAQVGGKGSLVNNNAEIKENIFMKIIK